MIIFFILYIIVYKTRKLKFIKLYNLDIYIRLYKSIMEFSQTKEQISYRKEEGKT